MSTSTMIMGRKVKFLTHRIDGESKRRVFFIKRSSSKEDMAQVKHESAKHISPETLAKF